MPLFTGIFRDIEETARKGKPSYFGGVEIRTHSGKISVPYFLSIAGYAIGIGCGDDSMSRIFCLGRVYGSEGRDGVPVMAVMLGGDNCYREVLKSELKYLDKKGIGIQLPLANGCEDEIVFVNSDEVVKLPVTLSNPIVQSIERGMNGHNLNGAKQLEFDLFEEIKFKQQPAIISSSAR